MILIPVHSKMLICGKIFSRKNYILPMKLKSPPHDGEAERRIIYGKRKNQVLHICLKLSRRDANGSVNGSVNANLKKNRKRIS